MISVITAVAIHMKDVTDLLVNFTLLDLACVGAGAVTALIFVPVFFGSFEGFVDNLQTATSWDYSDSRWAFAKLIMWLVPSAISMIISEQQFPKWFPGIFH